MWQLKQRRGAIVVMTGLMFVALVICGAVAIDFSRLWTERWELQTAADAGALAGAMQLLSPWDSLTYADSSRSYVIRNRALTDSITVDSTIKGNWDGNTRVFRPFPAGGDASNAVQVVVSQAPRFLFMQGFGVTVPRMKARAIAWATAPVASTPACIKPWAIPYEELMYRLNVYQNNPNPTDPNELSRTLTQADLNDLQTMPASARTFNMKLGSQTATGPYDPTSGNYQAVKLGKWWDYATQGPWTGQTSSSWTPGPDNGGSAYEGHINGSTCHGLAVGDVLESEPGDKTGKTIQGVCKNGNIGPYEQCDTPAVCTYLVGSGANAGDCINADGQVGVDVKAAFFLCASACGGRSYYEVKALGSFTLKKAYSKNGTDPVYGQYSAAQLVGEFKPIQATGAAGGSSTTLVKIVLVQ